MFEKDLIECVAIASKNEEGTEELLRIPVAHVYETESSVIAAFELPGAEKEDIELSITDEAIEVKSKRNAKEKTEGQNKHENEITSPKFYGIIPLPSEVVTENIDASFKNGMLRVEMPKAKKQELKKRIEIK